MTAPPTAAGKGVALEIWNPCYLGDEGQTSLQAWSAGHTYSAIGAQKALASCMHHPLTAAVKGRYLGKQRDCIEHPARINEYDNLLNVKGELPASASVASDG